MNLILIPNKDTAFYTILKSLCNMFIHTRAIDALAYTYLNYRSLRLVL